MLPALKRKIPSRGAIGSAAALAASLLVVGLLGGGEARAADSASLKAAKKEIKLGQGVRLNAVIQGFSASEQTTYQLEQAPFPYTAWEAVGTSANVSSARFSLNVKPRINTRYRISVTNDGGTVTSSSRPLVYVNPLNVKNTLKFRGAAIRIELRATYDSSFGDKWATEISRKDKFLYVFRACGNQSGAKTKYRRIATVPISVSTSGTQTTSRVSRSVRIDRDCSPYPSVWAGTYAGWTLPGILKNGDAGYGRPSVNRKVGQQQNRLKLKNALTPKQGQIMGWS